ncbi:MBL fold metallo-hydrolase [Actinospica durhamensis]|uniref:MBL fold metallo-hydrolase n=1 Tax=Actinospica durhamensis TaxID=1508375 RepID=A0A941IT32_9ACTN|nr:MBL fold metallo-hydrolase [Actinospica durhamensis]MBR7833906.1 MBL fold metallo-hydrolase [Actinospica durhamensis]
MLGAWLLWWRGNPAPTAAAPWVFAVCDVGQGDALFLATGAGEAVAVDTGPDPAKEDACATRLGITKVPLVILTHFHADHIDGLPGLLRGRSVGAIETTTVDDPPAGAAQVQRIAAAAGIPVGRVAPDEQRTLGPLSWRVLWPQAEHPLAQPMRMRGADGGGGGMAEDGPGENSGPNNSSIVMALTVRTDHGPLRILLTGDIETPVQQILLADRAPYLPADVLKVPHHGSANQDPAFLEAVHPSVSVISVGAGNPYGHPSPRTVYLAGDDGARVLRTDLDGMVLIGAPDGPNAPIPVRADKGEGVVPTAEPTPSGLGRTQGGSHSHSRHRRTHGGEGGSRDEGLGVSHAFLTIRASDVHFGHVRPLARLMSYL